MLIAQSCGVGIVKAGTHAHQMGPAHSLVRLESAQRSLAHFPGAARCPVYIMYHKEVAMEFCLWRGYTLPAGET